MLFPSSDVNSSSPTSSLLFIISDNFICNFNLSSGFNTTLSKFPSTFVPWIYGKSILLSNQFKSFVFIFDGELLYDKYPIPVTLGPKSDISIFSSSNISLFPLKIFNLFLPLFVLFFITFSNVSLCFITYLTFSLFILVLYVPFISLY